MMESKQWTHLLALPVHPGLNTQTPWPCSGSGWQRLETCTAQCISPQTSQGLCKSPATCHLAAANQQTLEDQPWQGFSGRRWWKFCVWLKWMNCCERCCLCTMLMPTDQAGGGPCIHSDSGVSYHGPCWSAATSPLIKPEEKRKRNFTDSTCNQFKLKSKCCH